MCHWRVVSLLEYLSELMFFQISFCIRIPKRQFENTHANWLLNNQIQYFFIRWHGTLSYKVISGMFYDTSHFLYGAVPNQWKYYTNDYLRKIVTRSHSLLYCELECVGLLYIYSFYDFFTYFNHLFYLSLLISSIVAVLLYSTCFSELPFFVNMDLHNVNSL